MKSPIADEEFEEARKQTGGRAAHQLDTDLAHNPFARGFARNALVVTPETKGRELSDLTRDPGETTDLAAAEPRRRPFAHFQAIGHDLTGRRWEVGLNPVYASQAEDPPPK